MKSHRYERSLLAAEKIIVIYVLLGAKPRCLRYRYAVYCLVVVFQLFFPLLLPDTFLGRYTIKFSVFVAMQNIHYMILLV